MKASPRGRVRRLIGRWWDANAEERVDLMDLLDEVRAKLDDELPPDGYNVGFNDGDAAGQTVGHLHIHLIPRWDGDMDDPRGGVRHVILSKGNYLRPAESRAQTAPGLVDGIDDRFPHLELTRLFDSRRFDRADLVVSFIMRSGLRLLDDRIETARPRRFLERQARDACLSGSDRQFPPQELPLPFVQLSRRGRLCRLD